MALGEERVARRHRGGGAEDQRLAAQRVRDRIIHSSALRRLGGVTQVVDPAEGYVFHNRLTHTLKVAQIARRLAEKLLDEQPEEAGCWGGLDPEVVETAALAHDLGHPPFGHVAEKELDKLVVKEDEDVGFDGFEGNAQSFRIVTKLSVRHEKTRGLNLTRASLNAMQKYPWFRESQGDRKKKWGAYRTEEKDFTWARDPLSIPQKQRTVEAEIMDWADDIAYAVHDMEDFYRAGLIPLHLLALYEREREIFLDHIANALEKKASENSYSVEDLRGAFETLMELVPVDEPYAGRRRQRAALRSCTGNLIRQYVMGGINLSSDFSGPSVQKNERFEMEIFLLQHLTRYFVIDNPRLATQQYGKAKVVRGLFRVLCDVATSNTASQNHWKDILPPRCREELDNEIGEDENVSVPRLIADVVSSLSDREALMLHRRFLGTEPGSALEALAI